MIMATTELLKQTELYDKICDQLEDKIYAYCKSLTRDKDIESCEQDFSYECEFAIDGYFVYCDLELVVYSEEVDESFDHEFGTFVATPYYKANAAEVWRVNELTVYDENDNEIEPGFDKNDLVGKVF